MTDRLKGLTVTFDRDIREDDAEGIINAIRHIKGVLSVDACVADHHDHMNRMRIQSEIREKIWEVFKN